MKNVLCACSLLAICLLVGHAVAQSDVQASSLCDLQVKTAEGEHRTVRVEGVYSAGLERQRLVDAACSSQSTAVEFALKSDHLKKTLQRLANESSQVHVVFEGEFYGPPIPDPKLPDAILKQYHPGWDYNSQTKLVVRVIRSVRAVQAGQRIVAQ